MPQYLRIALWIPYQYGGTVSKEYYFFGIKTKTTVKQLEILKHLKSGYKSWDA
jgi:hypothetical protein